MTEHHISDVARADIVLQTVTVVLLAALIVAVGDVMLLIGAVTAALFAVLFVLEYVDGA